jgi:hypothetical protein
MATAKLQKKTQLAEEYSEVNGTNLALLSTRALKNKIIIKHHQIGTKKWKMAQMVN